MSKSTKKSSKSTTVSNGLLLKGFRKQNGFSQAYIGEIVGKNSRTVSSYEVGRHNMPSSVISILNKKYKLYEVSGVSVDNINVGDNISTIPEANRSAYSDCYVPAVIKNYIVYANADKVDPRDYEISYDLWCRGQMIIMQE